MMIGIYLTGKFSLELLYTVCSRRVKFKAMHVPIMFHIYPDQKFHACMLKSYIFVHAERKALSLTFACSVPFLTAVPYLAGIVKMAGQCLIGFLNL
jgi:hypothetical protein